MIKKVSVLPFRPFPDAKPLKKAFQIQEVYSSAQLEKILPTGNFVYAIQPKMDGIRCQASKVKRRIGLFSSEEKQIPISKTVSIHQAMRSLPESIILDGELRVSIDGKNQGHEGVSKFIRSQEKMPGKLSYDVWDILFLNGKDLSSIPYAKRFSTLSNLRFVRPIVRVPNKWARKENIVPAAKSVQSQEGFIVRRADSSYWQNQLLYKVKRTFDVDVVVVKALKTAGKAEVYICADRQGNIVGRTYAQVHTKVRPGDIIRVMPTKIYRHKDPKTGAWKYHWYSPTVKEPEATKESTKQAVKKVVTKRKPKLADPQEIFRRIWEVSVGH